jgi:hypothetical protein
MKFHFRKVSELLAGRRISTSIVKKCDLGYWFSLLQIYSFVTSHRKGENWKLL